MSTSVKLKKDSDGVDVDPSLYRSMTGSLLYLTATRPDLSFSISMCARFQSSPKESHPSVVKRIIQYVKRTIDIGMWYPNDTNTDLTTFSDADFGRAMSTIEKEH
ncbi:hypothetical protein U1Q18_052642 [Sarracenia purpurea var. burkii]